MAAGTLANAVLSGGNTYREALEAGQTPGEAALRAVAVAGATAPLSVAQVGATAALSRSALPGAVKVLGGAGLESWQEVGEQAAQNVGMGRPAMEGAEESAALGLVGGLGMEPSIGAAMRLRGQPGNLPRLELGPAREVMPDEALGVRTAYREATAGAQPGQSLQSIIPPHLQRIQDANMPTVEELRGTARTPVGVRPTVTRPAARIQTETQAHQDAEDEALRQGRITDPGQLRDIALRRGLPVESLVRMSDAEVREALAAQEQEPTERDPLAVASQAGGIDPGTIGPRYFSIPQARRTALFEQGVLAKGGVRLGEAAERVGVSQMDLYRMLKGGTEAKEGDTPIRPPVVEIGREQVGEPAAPAPPAPAVESVGTPKEGVLGVATAIDVSGAEPSPPITDKEKALIQKILRREQGAGKSLRLLTNGTLLKEAFNEIDSLHKKGLLKTYPPSGTLGAMGVELTDEARKFAESPEAEDSSAPGLPREAPAPAEPVRAESEPAKPPVSTPTETPPLGPVSVINGYEIRREMYSEKRGDTGAFHVVFRLYAPDGKRAIRQDFTDQQRAESRARSLPPIEPPARVPAAKVEIPPETKTEILRLARYANERARRGQKYSNEGKLKALSKKVGVSFETIFADYQRARMDAPVYEAEIAPAPALVPARVPAREAKGEAKPAQPATQPEPEGARSVPDWFTEPTPEQIAALPEDRRSVVQAILKEAEPLFQRRAEVEAGLAAGRYPKGATWKEAEELPSLAEELRGLPPNFEKEGLKGEVEGMPRQRFAAKVIVKGEKGITASERVDLLKRERPDLGIESASDLAQVIRDDGPKLWKRGGGTAEQAGREIFEQELGEIDKRLEDAHDGIGEALGVKSTLVPGSVPLRTEQTPAGEQTLIPGTEQQEAKPKRKPSPVAVGIVPPFVADLLNRAGLRKRGAPKYDASKSPELAELQETYRKGREMEDEIRKGENYESAPGTLKEGVVSEFKGLKKVKRAIGTAVAQDYDALSTFVRTVARLKGTDLPSVQDPRESRRAYRHSQAKAEVLSDRLGHIAKIYTNGKAFTATDFENYDLGLQALSNIRREEVLTARPTPEAQAKIQTIDARIQELQRAMPRNVTPLDTSTFNRYLKGKEMGSTKNQKYTSLSKDERWKLAQEYGREKKKAERAVRIQDLLNRLDARKAKYQAKTLAPDEVNPGGLTAEQSRKAFAQLRAEIGPERFNNLLRSAKALGKFWKNMLEYSRRSGIVSEDAYQAILDENARTGDYLGPYRILEHIAETLDSPEWQKRRIPISRQDVIQRMRGTTKLNQSILVASIQKIARTVNQNERNRVMTDLYNLRKLGKDVEDVIVDADLSKDEKPPKGFDVVPYLDKGETKHFAVPKPVAEVLNGMDTQTGGLMIRMFIKSRNALRKGATTLAPTFAVRNPQRDIGTQLIKTEHPLNPFDPRDINLIRKAFVATLTEGKGGLGESYNLYRASGGAHTTREAMTRPGRTAEVVTGVKAGEGRIMRGAQASESMTRLAVFEKHRRYYEEKYGVSAPDFDTLFETGFDKADPRYRPVFEAGIQSATGGVDFSGAGWLFRDMNLVAPFVSSRMLGWLTNVQGATQHKTRALLVAAAGAAAVAALNAYNRRDEETSKLLDDVSPATRQNNFTLVLGSVTGEDGKKRAVLLTAAKPEFLQAVTGPIDDAIDMAYGRGGTVKGLVVDALSQLSPYQFADRGEVSMRRLFGKFEAPALSAIYGTQGRGYDAYRGTDLLTDEMATRKPEDQYRASTSLGARIIGKATGTAPVKVEYAVGRQFGELGRMALQLPELLAGEPEDRRALTKQERIGALPVVRAFYSTQGGEIERKLHKALDRAEEEAGSAAFDKRKQINQDLRKLKDMPQAEQNRYVYGAFKKDREYGNDLRDALKEERKGLGRSDTVFRRIQGMGIDGGQRAAGILNALKALPSDAEKKAFFEHLKKRGLIPAKVEKQILEGAEKARTHREAADD